MDRLRPALLRDMEAKGIDARLTLSILDDYNSGLYDSVGSVEAAGVPSMDGRTVVAMGPKATYRLPEREARERLESLGLALPASVVAESAGLGAASGRELVFPAGALEEIGASLLGCTAYGVLNGGSATSYADSKKNLAFGAGVFEALGPAFERLAPLCRGRPKGLSPAYVNPDGSPGESFLVLKMRARLLVAARLMAAERLREAARGSKTPKASEEGAAFLPLFQMTSVGNDEELAEAYGRCRSHPFLSPLAEKLGLEATRWMTGVQPMLAAYTHSSEGRPKRVFDRAQGLSDTTLALPGGHGQCFRVLASTLRELHESGIRFAYLGNVDNLGYLPESAEIAVLALSGLPAGFDFSLRTPVDVKGGILVDTPGGGRTVADIGPAISFEEVRRLEAGGASILFNCATGLFDLDWLVPRIEEIGRRLPLRFTDQDKDAGRYSQAEQVTWEVTSLLPGFVAFAVDKYDRFIEAKLLAEKLLTSGVGAGDPRIPAGLAETSRRLNRGLEAKLSGPYCLALEGGRWVPRDPL